MVNLSKLLSPLYLGRHCDVHAQQYWCLTQIVNTAILSLTNCLSCLLHPQTPFTFQTRFDFSKSGLDCALSLRKIAFWTDFLAAAMHTSFFSTLFTVSPYCETHCIKTARFSAMPPFKLDMFSTTLVNGARSEANVPRLLSCRIYLFEERGKSLRMLTRKCSF